MKPGKIQRGMSLLWIICVVTWLLWMQRWMPQLCEKIKVCPYLNRRHNLIKLFMASAIIQPGVVTPTERVAKYNINKIKTERSILCEHNPDCTLFFFFSFLKLLTQGFWIFNWLRLDSEDGFRTGCRNVRHKQQSFSGLQLPHCDLTVSLAAVLLLD